MPLTFVIGRAGSGKTFRCLEQITAAVRANPLGPPIWLIVPRQATFQFERELVARLDAFCRVRVVHPEQLGEEILAEVGGVAMPQVTAVGRRMVIGRLLYQLHDQLGYFGSSARRPGLAGSIDALFDEFERSGQTLGELGDLVDQLNHARPADGSPSLHLKLADLRLLYQRYSEYLGQDRLDPQRRREQMLKQLGKSELLRHAIVHVDSFHEFTDTERRLIAALAASTAKVEVNLPIDPDSAVLNGGFPDELSPLFPVEQTYARLVRALQEAGATITAPILLRKSQRFRAHALALVERRLGPAISGTPDKKTPTKAAPAQPIAPEASPVLFVEAPAQRVEVQAMAQRIRDLLSQGYRQRDILVLARRLEDYLHIIHAAFEEHDLSWFADRRRPATHHPLVRLLRAAIRVAREGYSTGAVISLVRTELAGLKRDEIDRLENYLIEHRIESSGWLSEEPWHYTSRILTAAEEEFDLSPPVLEQLGRSAQDTRDYLRAQLDPLVEKFRRGAPPAALRELVSEVLATLERFGARQTLARWIEQDREKSPELAEEHEQVWAQLVELFEQMVDVLGDQVVETGEMIEILESGLDGFDLAITPATLDQVLVGSVDRTRPPAHVRAVFVIGVGRGMFPLVHRDDSLLSSPERRELQKNRIDIEPDCCRKQLDERFLAYFAFTRGSEKLIVSRPLAGEAGQKLEPSAFWSALREIVPEAPVVDAKPCTSDDLDCISTPRDLVSSLLDWGRTKIDARPDLTADSAEEKPDDRWRWAIYDWAARLNDGAAPEMRRLIHAAWPALSYDNHATLKPSLAKDLFRTPLIVSAGQLESFASCPFQHFVSHGLRLARRGGGDVSLLDLSSIYHSTLEKVIAGLVEKKQELAALPHDEIAAIAKDFAPQVAVQLRGQIMLDDRRSAYLVDRVGRTLDMVLATLREQLGRGMFTPFKAGSAFGPEKKVKSPEIRLKSGESVFLRGAIDRVDCTPDGAVAVHDYRMSEQRTVAGSVYYGLSLRLLTCVLVLDRAKLSYRGKQLIPAAALCARLLRSLQSIDHPSEAIDPTSPEFRLSAKPRGVIRASHVAHFDKETTSGTSPVVAFSINKDGSFGRRDFSDICDDDEFQTLINFVEHKVAELSTRILGGEVEVRPYLYHDTTPCTRCSFRPICRFEPIINRYRKLEPLPRKQAFEKMQADLKKGATRGG